MIAGIGGHKDVSLRYLLLIIFAAQTIPACTVDAGGWSDGQDVIRTAVERLAEVRCPAGITARLTRVAALSLGDEGYSLQAAGSRYIVSAHGDRGALYGAYALADALENHGSLQPAQEGIFRPRFRYREWWSAAFQANFNLPLGGAFDRPIEEISQVVEKIIKQAPRYRINTLQLMGRAGEGGIDASWFLHYDSFPKLQHRQLGWGIQRRTEEIRRLAREAHRHGLDFLLWDHEIVFPDNMLQAYPEMRGVNYPYCFSNPLVFRFIDAKIDEFFRRLPEVDGIDLTFAETHGYNLLEQGGCQCDKCRRIPAEEKVRRVILAVYKACRRNGKRLEVRSYNQLPANAAVMLAALRGLPKDIRIVTKNTVVDFRGTDYPDNPMLGAFPGQPELIELTACPEGNGYGYIPALLGNFYKDKIARLAVERKLAGVAIRVDYHLQYGHATFFTSGPPVLTFDTANEFNIVAASRLAWDPAVNAGDLFSQWTRRKYGDKAAPRAAKALGRSAAISQGIFFVRGFSLLTHLDMVPHLATIDDELNKSYLLLYFPRNAEYRGTYEALKTPSENTIAAILAEKQAAVDGAEESLREVAGIPSLEHGFTVARNAAVLWKDIAAAYFRLRRVEQGLEDGTKLSAAVRAELDDACRMEKQSGEAWPVYPAARGVTAYDFAREVIERGKLCCVSMPACH